MGGQRARCANAARLPRVALGVRGGKTSCRALSVRPAHAHSGAEATAAAHGAGNEGKMRRQAVDCRVVWALGNGAARNGTKNRAKNVRWGTRPQEQESHAQPTVHFGIRN